ncbi:MAG: glycosyltransferase family 2 protein [Yoonia sp.]
MKNEAPYILEWVAHHLTVGFDHILVFTNDCSDGTYEILERLQEFGNLTVKSNHRGSGGIHRTALRQARRLDLIQNADWLYVTDADEFLNVHVGDHSVDALIAASGGDAVDIIVIPWRIFSYNKRPVLRDLPVTQQFTDAEPTFEEGGAGRRFVKSLFRTTDAYSRVGLHNPHIREPERNKLNWALPGGLQASQEPFGNHVPPPFGHDFAQINHYAVRSAQGYLLKKHRGRANHQSHILDTGYWDRWNRGGEQDTTIHRYAPKMNALLAEFRADETLSRLHRRGFRWHKNKLNELLKDPIYAKLYKKIAKSEPIRVSTADRNVRDSLPKTT